MLLLTIRIMLQIAIQILGLRMAHRVNSPHPCGRVWCVIRAICPSPYVSYVNYCQHSVSDMRTDTLRHAACLVYADVLSFRLDSRDYATLCSAHVTSHHATQHW